MLPAKDWLADPKSSRPNSIKGSIDGPPLKWLPSANSEEPITHIKENKYAPPVWDRREKGWIFSIITEDLPALREQICDQVKQHTRIPKLIN